MIRTRLGPVTLRFELHYSTKFGEELVVAGDQPELGEWDVHKGLHMTWSEGGWWSGEVTVPAGRAASVFNYKFAVLGGDGTVTWECGGNRTISALHQGNEVVLARDFWRTKEHLDDTVFSKAAFSRAAFSRPPGESAPAPLRLGEHEATVELRILAPRVAPEHEVYVCGELPALGAWDAERALRMSSADFPYWTAAVAVSRSLLPFSYKYLIRDTATGRTVAWEHGENRCCGQHPGVPALFRLMSAHAAAAPARAAAAPARAPVRSLRMADDDDDDYDEEDDEEEDEPASRGVAVRLRVTDKPFRFTSGPWRGAGLALPVFSLRTNEGMGVGEFLDLIPLVRWAARAGLRLVQLLPVNDTSMYGDWRDSYPYNSISVFALHPLYLRVAAIPGLSSKLQSSIRLVTDRLNAGPPQDMDYEVVMHAKMDLAQSAFSEVGASTLSSPHFQAFLRDNRAWLPAYALFSVLRDKYETTDFATWGAYSRIDGATVAELTAPTSAMYPQVSFHFFLQYHLHCQLSEASAFAESQHVALKGDLPIGVARNGCDAWLEPELFNLDKQTGAPPDDFAADGQNWGFPTYNWERMAKDGFAWWQRRLHKLAEYFHAFRIDHILGFFRIWEIPSHAVSGLLGTFHPVEPVWRRELEAASIWDFNRLCEPYVRWWTLNQTFGDAWQAVVGRYLTESHDGVYQLKSHMRTERGVEEALEADSDVIKGNQALAALGADALRRGLCSLVTNVCLLRDESDPEKFHFRIDMQKTSSYRELPPDVQGTLHRLYVRYFYETQEALWSQQAKLKLPALQNASDMLVCGEDLGMVPACVPGVMDDLGILALRIQRMPADPKIEFGDTFTYPYLSVCSPSTHDMSTIRGWWEEDRTRTQRYYNHVMGWGGEAPLECTAEVAKAVVDLHLRSSSMWAIFPMQDLLAMDEGLRLPDPRAERINVPANPRHYWRYRLHLTVDQLSDATGFTSLLRGMLAHAGRDA